MSVLTWEIALLQLGIGLVASALAGLMVGLVFERRSREELRRFQVNVLVGFVDRLSAATTSLAALLRRIPEMATNIGRLEPIVGRLCDAVERTLKQK